MIVLSKGVGAYVAEHGNRPIFSAEFGKIIYILADFENGNTDGHGYFHFDRYLMDISI